MEKKYSEISFCIKNYKDYDEMMYGVKDCLQVLLQNGYQVQLYDEEHYVVVIRFNYRDESMSGVTLEWLGEDDVIIDTSDMEAEADKLAPPEEEVDYESYDSYIMPSEIDELY